MKLLFAILLVLLGLLQYKLWFDAEGIRHTWHLQEDVASQQQQNKQLKQRNTALAAEVKDLKQGSDAIEERARNELGLIKKGEAFYQIIKEK